VAAFYSGFPTSIISADMQTIEQVNAPSSATLKQRLVDRIRAEGPIAFCDWMNAALYDPVAGYYFRSDLKRWGREGDYRTSPERSDLFGATFARYFAQLYDELQRPSEFTIVELGAGSGRFAEVVLLSLKSRFPEVFAATRYIIDEASEYSRHRAGQRTAAFGERVQFARLPDLPPIRAGIVFTNELVDALPVHRLIKSQGKLVELYVALDTGGEFVWCEGPLSTPRLSEFCQAYTVELRDKQIIEVSLAADEWVLAIAKSLATGYAITVDYGAEQGDLFDFTVRPQGTLRAFRRHQFVDNVLLSPGDCDITATVNWTQLRTAGKSRGLETVALLSQDKFLIQAGLLEELQARLDSSISEADKLRLSTSAREMILPGSMAANFQVLIQKRS
jgi:SAM-dependent MidA family methyltransferase